MIVSQLGYDSRLPRHALLRLDEHAAPPGPCHAMDANDQPVLELAPQDAGTAWGSRYWKIDLAPLPTGRFRLRYRLGTALLTSQSFAIAPRQWFDGAWQRFHYELCIRFMENGLPHGGYMDCGSPLRELSSHSETGQTLARCLESPMMDEWTAGRFRRHLAEIARYLRACRIAPGVYAHEAPGGDGELHEWCRAMRTLHDTALAGLAHAAAWRVLRQPEDLADARDCAQRLLRDLPAARTQQLCVDETYPERRRFEPWRMYETSPDLPLPGEYRTPVLLRTAHLCWLLFEATQDGCFREGAETYLNEVRSMQVREGDIRGDFLAWPGTAHRQKMFEDSWVAYFKGCVHGHALGGLSAVAASGDTLARTARAILTEYLDGYLLPLARSNPFGLPPNGVHADGAPRWFTGIRHGMNGTYAMLLADALRAGDALGRDDLIDDAARIALWFAGVNPGRRESPDVPWHGVSCHYGRGEYFAQCWTHMPNAVSNGFSAGPQFFIEPVGPPEEDAPVHWHDEDWIVHSAAIVDLLTALETHLQGWDGE